MYRTLDKGAYWLARLMAYVGGAVLIAVIVTTCISIFGRSLLWAGLGPIQGDFEIVEFGIGFAIFAFLPWCQYARGNARVDLFTPAYPAIMNRVIDLIADLLTFGAAYIITWRLYLGMLDKQKYHETSFILQFPVWIGYLIALIGAVAFTIVAAFCVIRSLKELTKGGHYEQL